MMEQSDRPLTKKERLGLAAILCALAGAALLAESGCQSFEPQYLPAAAAIAPRMASASGSGDAGASYVFQRQRKIIREMSADYGVDIDVRWVPCGEENSYYFPGFAPHIELCTEMSAHPGAAVMFAAHEAGHAVTDALADITDEGAADEVAMIAMVKHGYLDEMLDGAIYYLEDDRPKDHRPGDPHPSHAYRAWEFACVADGAESGIPECVELYHALVLKWGLRLVPRTHDKTLDFDLSVFAPHPPIAR